MKLKKGDPYIALFLNLASNALLTGISDQDPFYYSRKYDCLPCTPGYNYMCIIGGNYKEHEHKLTTCRMNILILSVRQASFTKISMKKEAICPFNTGTWETWKEIG